MTIDTSKLPKSTPKSVVRLVAEQAERIGELDERIVELNARLDAEASSGEPGYDTSVFDRVNRRVNEYGDILNCRIAENYDGPVTFRVMAKALRTSLAPRGKQRRDTNGRRWIDVYPAVSQKKNLGGEA